jgi:Tfp pilus assembly protein PilF
MFRPLRTCVLAAALLAAGLAPALGAAAANPPAAEPAAAATEPAAPAAPAPSLEMMLRDAQSAAARGDIAAALQLHHTAIIFAPAEPAAYNALAQLHANENQLELAQRYYTIALEIDPANPTALKGLALLELAAGDRASAEARHAILVRACGQTCPETIQVAQALMAAPAPMPN